MYAFSSPGILKESFDATLARDGTKWLLVTPKGNGFLESRELAHLNYSTTSEPTTWSEAKRPCFWFDSDWDRRPQPWSDLLAALLAIEPGKAPIRRTGRTQKMTAEGGGEREAVEVELMMDEDELCKVCYYCGDFESNRLGEEPYPKIRGDGYTSTYSCHSCTALPPRARNAERSKRTGVPVDDGLLQRCEIM